MSRYDDDEGCCFDDDDLGYAPETVRPAAVPQAATKPALQLVQTAPAPAIPDEEESKGNGFFAVDLRQWNRVCDLKLVNAAVAYLIMARGTGGDHRTTSWSTNSIEQRTRISRPRAKATIALLEKEGFVSIGSGKRPRRKIIPPPGAAKDYEPDWTWLPNTFVDEGEGEGMGAFSPIERLRATQNNPQNRDPRHTSRTG